MNEKVTPAKSKEGKEVDARNSAVLELAGVYGV
jgi:hypothetical protein